MELTTLAAKQKRLRTWTIFVDQEVHDQDLRTNFLATLELYKASLARCWKQGQATANDVAEIEDLERRLEDFDELARLTVVPGARMSAHRSRTHP